MVYYVETPNHELQFFNNYYDASQEMLNRIDSMSRNDRKHLHNNKENTTFYIYEYDGDIPLESFVSNYNDMMSDEYEMLHEIIAEEFECVTFIDFSQMSDFQFSNLSLIGFWYTLDVCEPVINWDHEVLSELECWCKEINIYHLDSDWYGDHMPQDWIKEITSVAYNLPHDFHSFANTCESLYKEIQDSYELAYENQE